MKVLILFSLGTCLSTSWFVKAADDGTSWTAEYEKVLSQAGLKQVEFIKRLEQINDKYPNDNTDTRRRQAEELVKLSNVSVNKCTKLNIATQLNWPTEFSNEQMGLLASHYRDEQIKLCVKFFETFIQVAANDIGKEKEMQLRSLVGSMIIAQGGTNGDLTRQAMHEGILMYLKRNGVAVNNVKLFKQQYELKLIRLCRVVEATNISKTLTSSYMRIYQKNSAKQLLDEQLVEIAKGADICHTILMDKDSLRDEIHDILEWNLVHKSELDLIVPT